MDEQNATIGSVFLIFGIITSIAATKTPQVIPMWFWSYTATWLGGCFTIAGLMLLLMALDKKNDKMDKHDINRRIAISELNKN